jgi:hypothetical protein
MAGSTMMTEVGGDSSFFSAFALQHLPQHIDPPQPKVLRRPELQLS